MESSIPEQVLTIQSTSIKAIAGVGFLHGMFVPLILSVNVAHPHIREQLPSTLKLL